MKKTIVVKNTWIKKAKAFATKAHKGQFRKVGYNVPYITHPAAVAEKVSSELEKMVAWMHDTVEDTNVTFKDIIREFADYNHLDELMLAMEAITYSKDKETYEEYIQRVRKNDVAASVKLADIEHNMSTSPLEWERSRDKWKNAVIILAGGTV